MRRGQTDKRGITAYQVGTVGAKHWLYSRLSTDADKAPEDRTTHFTDELAAEYFAGLVSETYNPAKNRFDKRRGARNEALDTWVYAYAAAHHPELRLHRFTRADWDALEARLLKATATVAADPEPAIATPPAHPPVRQPQRPARARTSPGPTW